MFAEKDEILLISQYVQIMLYQVQRLCRIFFKPARHFVGALCRWTIRDQRSFFMCCVVIVLSLHQCQFIATGFQLARYSLLWDCFISNTAAPDPPGKSFWSFSKSAICTSDLYVIIFVQMANKYICNIFVYLINLQLGVRQNSKQNVKLISCTLQF